jgi:hypothetical protein
MGTIRIAILEKDGVEYDTSVEMDLASALAFIGFTGSGFSVDSILTDDKFSVLVDYNSNVVTGG